MKIALTSLFVDDQRAALAFYTEVLGFTKRHDIPSVTTSGSPSCRPNRLTVRSCCWSRRATQP